MKSLCDLCIETLSRNLDMYDCLELLPSFIVDKILSRFQSFFKHRLGKLNDESVVGYLDLLSSEAEDALTSLNLPWCNRLTDHGLGLVAVAQQPLLSRIKTVNLAYCSSISDEGVAALAKTCPLLVRLDLTFTAVGDRGIGSLVQHNSRCLERLSLEQCQLITDEGIQTLARGFKRGRLTHLNVGGLKKVSNVGIQILASHLKSLRMLSLSGCDCLIDFDIQDICKDLVMLEELRLRCCWRLTDTSVRHIAKLCRKQMARGVTSAAGTTAGRMEEVEEEMLRQQRRRRRVIEGGASSPRTGFGICMRRLDLGGCKRITSRGVVCVAKSAVRLEHLDLRGMGNVTDDTLGTIRGVLTSLKSLNVAGCECTPQGVELMRDRGVDVIDGKGERKEKEMAVKEEDAEEEEEEKKIGSRTRK